jgi:hypothetical protein
MGRRTLLSGEIRIHHAAETAREWASHKPREKPVSTKPPTQLEADETAQQRAQAEQFVFRIRCPRTHSSDQ